MLWRFLEVAPYCDGRPVCGLSTSQLRRPHRNVRHAGLAIGVAVSGRYAYVASVSSGLQIIDVSNPASPTLAGIYDTPGSAIGVAVSGSYAYVADDDAGRQIIHLVNPSSPILAATYDTPNFAHGVAVSGKYAYVADTGSGLRVLDITNPYMPSEAGYFDSDGSTRSMAVAGGYAFLADGDQGSYLLHFSGQCVDPFEPNDQRELSSLLVGGTLYDSKICVTAAQDWFVWTASGAGTIEAMLESPAGANLDLVLTDSAGSVLAASSSSGTDQETLSHTISAAGSYHFLVRGHSNSQFSGELYTLYFIFTPAGGGSCTQTPDEAVYIYTVTLDLNGKPVLHIRIPTRPGR